MNDYYVLKIQYTNRAPETRNVSAPSTSIGREVGDIVLGDPQTSGRHAEILFERGQVRVRDLGSTNGTWFSGQRLGEFNLMPGQSFQAGQTTLQLVAVHGPELSAKTMMSNGAPPPPGASGAQPPSADPTVSAPLGSAPPSSAVLGHPGRPASGPVSPTSPLGTPARPPTGPNGSTSSATAAFGSAPPSAQGISPPAPAPGFAAPPAPAPNFTPPPAPTPGFAPPAPAGYSGNGMAHPMPHAAAAYGAPPSPASPATPGQFGYGGPSSPPGLEARGASSSPGLGPLDGAAALVPSQMAGTSSPTGFKARFEGTGTDFFVTFLAGYLLTGLTVGIYLPWFLCKLGHFVANNTRLSGTSQGELRVEFRGEGATLAGPLLGHGALALITGGIYAPWFITRLLNYALAHTSFVARDNTRYHARYVGTGSELFVLMLVHGLLTCLTAGIWFPWYLCRLRSHFATKTELLENGVVAGGLHYVATGAEMLVKVVAGFALTLLTLGFYGPWWLVKLKRFKLEHTWVHFKGRTFAGRFHGTGLELLELNWGLGFLIAATFGVYTPRWIVQKLKFELGSLEFVPADASTPAFVPHHPSASPHYPSASPHYPNMPPHDPSVPHYGGPPAHYHH